MHLKDIIFWSTIAFAFGGVESGSTMGEEIEDARRTVPRAILGAGAVITVLYIAGDVRGAAGDAEGSGVRPVGHHAGDSGDDGEGRRRLAGAGGRRHWSRSTRSAAPAAGSRRRRGCRSSPASIAFCRRRSAICIRRWRTPYVALLVQAAIAGAVRVPRPGGDVGARRLRRAGVDGHHRLLHPVPVHVRGDDRAAARAGGAGA